MSRETEALYEKVFEKMQELVPQFSTSYATADFEEASVSAFRRVFRDVTVTGWFYFVQSIIKRVLGLKDEKSFTPSASHCCGYKTSCVDHKDRNDMWPTAAFAYSFTMPTVLQAIQKNFTQSMWLAKRV